MRKLSKGNVNNVEMYAGRVTGMILDGQKVEYILHLCSNKPAFFNIVDEAMVLLIEYDKQHGQ